ncbi:MAG TPA: amidohydrolase family protein, partial [Firmicutes bacterium]|nr:amidohydrolase family protein [Bacillota bacterium]
DYELDWSWRSMGEFLTALERRAPAVNLACLVGHGAIRTAVMGFDNHAPSTAELAEIQHYADEAMAAGAFGVSTGLGYPPGAWADTDELIEVARIAGTHDGLYVTHMRNEAEELLESVRESLLVGERAGCPVQISHHKVAGRPNWGMVEQSLAMLGAAREAGRRVAVDVYPYTGGSGYLSALLPMEVWEGGLEAAWRRLQDDSFLRNLRMQVSGVDWTTITIRGVRSSKNREFIDLNMQQISGLMGRDPIESMVELLVQEQGAVLMTTFGTLSEQDVRRVIQSGLSMIGSDGLPARDARPHPRTYGAFTRFLATYALRQELLPFEKAVMKCTSYPARFFGLTGRGLISEGAKADLVVLDPGALDDGASIEEPRRRSPGVRHVIVNGVRVLEDGRLTGNRPGCVLRRQCPGSY